LKKRAYKVLTWKRNTEFPYSKAAGFCMQNVSSLTLDDVLGIAVNSNRFVCAWDVEPNLTKRFGNYQDTSEARARRVEKETTIWEAARATLAAPFYFPPAYVDDRKFWDGG